MKVTFTGQINFALFRHATQSSTHDSLYGANNAVDGNMNSLSLTTFDHNLWWKVQLRYVVWVSRVEIFNFVDKCG